MATTDALYCREEMKHVLSTSGIATGVKAKFYMVRQGKHCFLRIANDGAVSLAVGAGSVIAFALSIPDWMMPDPLLYPNDNTLQVTGFGMINVGAGQVAVMASVFATGVDLWTLTVPAAVGNQQLTIGDLGLANPSTIGINGITVSYIGKDLDV